MPTDRREEYPFTIIEDLERRVLRLERASTPVAILLELGVDWDAYGSGWADPSYYVDASGSCHLAGRSVQTGSDAAIAALPFGPEFPESFAVAAGGSPPALIDVHPDGQVVYVSGGDPGDWISLSGISFLVAPA